MSSIMKIKIAVLNGSVSKFINIFENNIYNYDELTELLDFLTLANKITINKELLLMKQIIEDNLNSNEFVLK